MQKTIIYDSISIFEQFFVITKIIKHNTLIIVPDRIAQISLIKLLANSESVKQTEDFIEIQTKEKELSFYGDITALKSDMSVKNIINATSHPLIKPELKIDWETFLKSNNMPKIEDLPLIIRDTVEKTIAGGEILDIWLNNTSETELMTIEEIEKKYLDLTFEENIKICLFSDVSTKNIMPNVIITNSNAAIYNAIVPFLQLENIDIMPSVSNSDKYNFSIASVCLQASNLCLFNNLLLTDISYFLLFFNKTTIVKKQIFNIEYQNINLIGKGQLNCTLTPKIIEKMVKNPFFFYLENILKIKETYTIQEYLFDSNIEKIASTLVTIKEQPNYAQYNILDKYKILKNVSNIIKTLKIESILNDKYLQTFALVNNFNGNELIFYPDFVTQGINSKQQCYFYTKASDSAIKNQKDILSTAIIATIKNDKEIIFINYNSGAITKIENNQNNLIVQDLIQKYVDNAIYELTDDYSGFSRKYQQICRKLLINTVYR